MAKDVKSSGKRRRHFKRKETVHDFRDWGDRRWCDAAKKDLKELGEDDEGLTLLARAIQAILRK